MFLSLFNPYINITSQSSLQLIIIIIILVVVVVVTITITIIFLLLLLLFIIYIVNQVEERLREGRHYWERDNNGSVGVQRLVLAGRLRWRLVCADEGRSVLVDGEGRDRDLWAASSPMRTTLMREIVVLWSLKLRWRWEWLSGRFQVG